MKKEGKITYTLLINEPSKGEHGVIYQSDLDGDMAALLMTAEILQNKLESLKQMKKDMKSKKDKDAVGANIALFSKGLSAINNLSSALCDIYEDYINEMAGQLQMQKEHEEFLTSQQENLEH